MSYALRDLMEDEEEYLGGAKVPGDGGALRLSRRGAEFTLRVHDTELMSSASHESEDRLAQAVCEKLAGIENPTVLIGGLGMGYTLAAALKALGPKAEVIVAELIPSVVSWNRGPLAHLAGNPLSDARVQVRQEDVALSFKGSHQAFDAIILDVDNGPEALTRDSNNWLYGEDGLAAAYAALRPNGILAVWSSTPEKSFTMRLWKLGFAVEEVRVERHTIWLAVNRA